MPDIVTAFGGGLIHHGKDSDRIYVLKAPKDNVPAFIAGLDRLAQQKTYGKIIAKVPAAHEAAYRKNNYGKEAFIPRYYAQKQDCVFMCRYPDTARKAVHDAGLTKDVLSTAQKKKTSKSTVSTNLPCDRMGINDAEAIAGLYRQVFISYPFPIFDQGYLQEIMADGTALYFGIRRNGQLIAAAAAEIDQENRNAEMTDFAVAPAFRSKNLAAILLTQLEAAVKENGIPLAYTIARSSSYGMNTTFAKNGYHFTGTLYNNTQIAGKIESMNIWYKQL